MIDFTALTPHCPPAQEEDIREAEEVLSVILPDSYKRFVKKTNGVYLSARYPILEFTEELSTFLSNDFVPVFDILGVNKLEHRHNNFELNELIEEWGVEGEKVCTDSIIETEYLSNEWNLPKSLVLLSGDGHTWIALDYRQVEKDPPVIFIESENCHWCKIADNFEQFLCRLVEEESTS